MTRVALPVPKWSGSATPRWTAGRRGAGATTARDVTCGRGAIDAVLGAGVVCGTVAAAGRAIELVLGAAAVVTAAVAVRGAGALVAATVLGSAAKVGRVVCNAATDSADDGSARPPVEVDDVRLMPMATVAQPATTSEAATPPAIRARAMGPVCQL
jgi:hypothetical protein